MNGGNGSSESDPRWGWLGLACETNDSLQPLGSEREDDHQMLSAGYWWF